MPRPPSEAPGVEKVQPRVGSPTPTEGSQRMQPYSVPGPAVNWLPVSQTMQSWSTAMP
jgi:hypothetical protein